MALFLACLLLLMTDDRTWCSFLMMYLAHVSNKLGGSWANSNGWSSELVKGQPSNRSRRRNGSCVISAGKTCMGLYERSSSVKLQRRSTDTVSSCSWLCPSCSVCSPLRWLMNGVRCSSWLCDRLKSVKCTRWQMVSGIKVIWLCATDRFSSCCKWPMASGISFSWLCDLECV